MAKSTRLTNALRNEIFTVVFNYLFQDKVEAYDKAINEVAHDAYKKAVANDAAAMGKLRSGMLAVTKMVYISDSDTYLKPAYIRLSYAASYFMPERTDERVPVRRFCGDSSSWDLVNRMPVPYDQTNLQAEFNSLPRASQRRLVNVSYQGEDLKKEVLTVGKELGTFLRQSKLVSHVHDKFPKLASKFPSKFQDCLPIAKTEALDRLLDQHK